MMPAEVPTLHAPAAGPPVEREIALDLVRRGWPAVPVFVVVGAIFWGGAGAASAGYAVGLVALNFLLAAALLGWAARISLATVMATALFGYAARLGLLFLAVWLVRDAGWFEPLPLGLALVTTHLGLLFWEMRFLSVSFAHPGLRPTSSKEMVSR